jgi:hypothetical protein
LNTEKVDSSSDGPQINEITARIQIVNVTILVPSVAAQNARMFSKLWQCAILITVWTRDLELLL